MRCEYCTRKLGWNEIVHGIRHGTADVRTDVFIPDQDSATTIICQPCGKKLLTMIYQKTMKTTYL